MMLIAGLTWRAALFPCGKQSGPQLTGPAPGEQRGREDPPPPGQGVVSPTYTSQLAVEPSTGVTTLAVMVDPSGFPVDATVIHGKNGDYVKQTQFFERVANGTPALDDDEEQTSLAQRWPGAA
jgi:hypothetical protein